MESIDEKIYEEIKSFCNALRGDFDGMIDLCTYRNNVKSEDGIYFSFGTSYIFLLINHHTEVKNTI